MTIHVDKAKAKGRIETCASFWKRYGRYPLTTSKDQEERRLGLWLSNMRGAKRGLGTITWLPEYDELAIRLGCPDMLEPKSKSFREWITIAERLTEENNGMLPGRITLYRLGMSGLCRAIERHPHHFEHIKRLPSGIDRIKNWIPIAEELQEKFGAVPRHLWLIKNGYGGLYSASRHYPRFFKHLTFSSKHRTVEEWVSVAEDLAKSNNGVVPSHNWMNRNGYSGLVKVRQSKPELFTYFQG